MIVLLRHSFRSYLSSHSSSSTHRSNRSPLRSESSLCVVHPLWLEFSRTDITIEWDGIDKRQISVRTYIVLGWITFASTLISYVPLITRVAWHNLKLITNLYQTRAVSSSSPVTPVNLTPIISITTSPTLSTTVKRLAEHPFSPKICILIVVEAFLSLDLFNTLPLLLPLVSCERKNRMNEPV